MGAAILNCTNLYVVHVDVSFKMYWRKILINQEESMQEMRENRLKKCFMGKTLNLKPKYKPNLTQVYHYENMK